MSSSAREIGPAREGAPVAHAPTAVIQAIGLGKCYPLYDKPVHRLYQSLLGSRHRFYREFWALRGVDLQLHRGETLGIIGRNGAGKSTLLQLLAGTLRPSEGAVTRRGRVAALLELGSGFNPDYTGRQNVYLNASILGLSRQQIDARIDAILAYADIGEFIDQPVRNYSTGMVMRLAFAVTVHVDADVLIIDEALAVGDAFFMQKCMRSLRAFRARGSMLFVSHDGGAVTSLCDRALWLDHGRVELIDEARKVMEAYLAASIVERQGEGPRPTRLPLHRDRADESVDVRQALLDRSTLRNDLHVAPFHPGAAGVGRLDAELTHAGFYDAAGRRLAIVLGGERVTLRVEVTARGALARVAIGFYVKDRLGQLLFGDSTLFSQAAAVNAVAGDVLEARFRFVMPRLAPGDYFVAAGVAEGSLEQCVVQHWVHEALKFSAEGGTIASGLVGLPMLDIQLERRHAQR